VGVNCEYVCLFSSLDVVLPPIVLLCSRDTGILSMS